MSGDREFRQLNPQGFINLSEAFLGSCSEFGDEPAFHSLGASFSFSQLEELSRKLAAWLTHEAGLAYGDRLAVQLPNIAQYPIVAWAAIRAGLVLVNTNPMYTERELLHQFRDSGARALIVLSDLMPLVEKVVPQTLIETVVTTSAADLLRPSPVAESALPNVHSLPEAIEQGARYDLPVIVTTMDDIAALQYTGGTTGEPKGAMLTHGNLFCGARMSTLAFDRNGDKPEIVIAPMPLYHIYGFAVNVISGVLHGRQSVLIPDPRDIAGMIAVMKKFSMTGMAGVNTLFAGLLQHPDFDQIDFSRADAVVSGGTTLIEEIAVEWRRRTGSTIYEGYGLSETAASATVNPQGASVAGSVGKAVPCVSLKVLDQHGNEQPPGHEGELLIRGPQVMRGYWNRPDATAEVMDDKGWMRTGDVAVIDEAGYVRIVDRIKDMVLVSGFNVYPNEIEEVVHLHPDVVECAAVGVADPRCGQAIRLFVVPASETLTEESVIAWCRDRLTSYKIPKVVDFRDTLPKSNVGKVLRRVLRDIANDGGSQPAD